MNVCSFINVVKPNAPEVIVLSNNSIKAVLNLILAQSTFNYRRIWTLVRFIYQPPDALVRIRLWLHSAGALNESFRWMETESACRRRQTSHHLPLTRTELKPDPPVRLELRWLKHNLWSDNGVANMPIKMKIKHQKAILGVYQNKKNMISHRKHEHSV